MSYIFTRAEAQGSSIVSTAFKMLANWVTCASVGDFARVIIRPVWTSRAVYGSPIQAGKLLFLERLLLGGDIAIVHSFKRKLIIIPEETLTALLAALDE